MTKRKEEADCRVCGTHFQFQTSQLNHYANAGTYCSIECARKVPGECVVCGAAFTSSRGLGRYCRAHKGKFYLALGEIERKGWALSGTLALKNKRVIVVAMLRAAIGQPCEYCGTKINVKNASIDHKNPIGQAAKSGAEIRRPFDVPANLHIICRVCNQRKGDLNDSEFRVLTALPFYPKLARRLSSSTGFFAVLRARAKMRVA